MPRLKLVPFEPTWLENASLDIHSIYLRPQRYLPEGELSFQIVRDGDGFIVWDVTTPQSIKNHTKLLLKGFKYVTLATPEDVIQAANPDLAQYGTTPLGHPPRDLNERAEDYIRQTPYSGPWNCTAYLLDMADERQLRLKKLMENIAKYGPDGAEEFERQLDPGYRLPEKYRAPSEELTPRPPRRRGRPPKAKPSLKTAPNSQSEPNEPSAPSTASEPEHVSAPQV